MEIKIDPRSVMQKWKDLSTAGVSVDEEIQISTDNQHILLPELSKGGTCEFVDFQELFRLGLKPPEWLSQNKKEVFSQLIRNFELAYDAGYYVKPDSWFVTHNKSNDEIKVIVRDLGQGVIKHLQKVEGHKRPIVVSNIAYPLATNFGIYSTEEWDSDFPEYAIKPSKK